IVALSFFSKSLNPLALKWTTFPFSITATAIAGISSDFNSFSINELILGKVCPKQIADKKRNIIENFVFIDGTCFNWLQRAAAKKRGAFRSSYLSVRGKGSHEEQSLQK